MTSRSYELIGAAFGLGATRAETAMAPGVLREAGLFEKLLLVTKDIVDCGDVSGPTASLPPSDPKLRYLPEYLQFSRAFIPRIDPFLIVFYRSALGH